MTSDMATPWGRNGMPGAPWRKKERGEGDMEGEENEGCDK